MIVVKVEAVKRLLKYIHCLFRHAWRALGGSYNEIAVELICKRCSVRRKFGQDGEWTINQYPEWNNLLDGPNPGLSP